MGVLARGTPPRGAGVGNPGTTHFGTDHESQRNTAPRRRGWKHAARAASERHTSDRGTPPRGAGVGNLRRLVRNQRVHVPQRNTAPRRRGWKRHLEFQVAQFWIRRGTPPRGAGVGNMKQSVEDFTNLTQRNTAPRRRGWKLGVAVGNGVEVGVRGTPPRGAGVGNAVLCFTPVPSVRAEEHRPAAQGLETRAARTSAPQREVQRNTAPRRRGWKQMPNIHFRRLSLRRGTPPRGAGVGNF